ncbi:hypothetical protein QYF68_04990 [Mycolicibacterium austroafricanum]|uniref:Uncharacterized protein n=1 Tax=Mycolicibacterium austroafricanum TaxID=39687 RepID=A0ABT8H8U2_MYCAO|nr:hypothetical protein [Mycolicibacterium austroafricanum]MDN4517180.1 hypothetical protein [Mycolicibacterium austroafricanum]
MVSATPHESRSVTAQRSSGDEQRLDAAYAELATSFNEEVTDAERRAARTKYIDRREPGRQ